MLKLLHNLPVPDAIRAAAMAQCNPRAVGFNKSQSGKAHQQADAQPAVLAPHQAHQVHAGHDPGGVQLHDLQLNWHTMELLKVFKDKFQLQFIKKRVGTHPHQEKEGRVEQHAVSHERGCSQEGLMPPTSLLSYSITFMLHKKDTFPKYD